MRRALAGVAACAGTTIACVAGTPPYTVEVLVMEGDTVPGVGLITSIANLAVNNQGDWIVEADTDAATDVDAVLIRNGSLYLREGDPLPAPSGAALGGFDAVNLNSSGNSGWNFFLDGTTGTSDDSGIYFNTSLVIQESDVSTAPQFSAGTPYIGFFEAWITDNNLIYVMASVDDPAIASAVDRAIVELDMSGAGPSVIETVLAKEGDILPGQTEAVADFQTGQHEMAVNSVGDILFVADLAGDTAVDGAAYLNGVLIAQEGSASPAAGRNWLSFSSVAVDLNAHGDWALRASLDGDTASNTLIAVNGAPFVQEGDSPASIGGFLLTSLGTSGPVELDNLGNVVWWGDWNDPNTTIDTGLFYNMDLLLQENTTIVDGMTVTSVAGVEAAFEMSENGRYLICEVTLNGNDAALLFTFENAVLGDLDGDGDVDGADLAILLGEWGPCGAGPSCPADLSGDGEVGGADLAILLGEWS